MSRRHRVPFAALAGVLAALALSGTAGATGIADRTVRVSLGINGTAPDGSSTRPFVDARGDRVAFDSTASNLALDLDRGVRDVFVRDIAGGVTRLVSVGLDGAAADGSSSGPVLSAGGGVIAFTSSATNLVAGDGNGAADVFARSGNGAVERLSVTPSGGSADGASGSPDISASGRYVAFTSLADDLVSGDRNGKADVFVADRSAHTVRRVSVAPGGGDADGASGAPAISPDGRYVAFFSLASDLVSGDTNGIGDIFLADLRTGRIQRVSVSSGGRQQNRSVIAPFLQVSDVSARGRFVAFDSDATDLVARDRNKHTDVFVRDIKHHRTVLASTGLDGLQGNNDSFYPRITPDGRRVAFDSFADNLYPGAARGPNVFVRDLKLKATSDMSVTASNHVRGREHVKLQQLLQRPSLSDDGSVVGLTSTASLVPGDDDHGEDAYVRLAAAPRARIALAGRAYHLSADDPVARRFLCRVRGRPALCKRRGRLPGGRFAFRVRAIGLGTLAGPQAVRRVG
jgi:Tol biopolymer transport system component